MKDIKRNKTIHTVFNTKTKLAIKSIACAFIVCFTLSMTEFDAQSREISEEVIRLHILANSDSDCDQALKLKVRDRVQEMCRDIYPDNCTKLKAEEILSEKLPSIINEAQKIVKDSGYDYEVRGKLVNMYFSNRVYDDVTLPAGNYDAVRLTIGSGEGHNWWCVMFPPICISASGGEISDVLNEEETELVTSDKVEYKFKIYEVYENIVNHMTEKSKA